MIRLLLFAGVALMLTSVQTATAQDRATVDAELRAVYDRFSEAYRQADAEAFREIYTEDAFYLQPGQHIQRGLDEIVPGFRQFLERFEPGKGPNISFEIVDRDVSGNLAYDIGYYTIGDGEPSGKFIVIWKRGTDGNWRIHADGYSGMQP